MTENESLQRDMQRLRWDNTQLVKKVKESAQDRDQLLVRWGLSITVYHRPSRPPANTRRWPNIETMLGQRRRRWAMSCRVFARKFET